MFEVIYRKYCNLTSSAIYKQIDKDGNEVLVWSDGNDYWKPDSNAKYAQQYRVEIMSDKELENLKVQLL